MEIRRKKISN